MPLTTAEDEKCAPCARGAGWSHGDTLMYEAYLESLPAACGAKSPPGPKKSSAHPPLYDALRKCRAMQPVGLKIPAAASPSSLDAKSYLAVRGAA